MQQNLHVFELYTHKIQTALRIIHDINLSATEGIDTWNYRLLLIAVLFRDVGHSYQV